MKIQMGWVFHSIRSGTWWHGACFTEPLFMPEEKNSLTLVELKEIVREMEKMNAIRSA